MKTIEHEGATYILKDDVDGLVRERIAKIAESKRVVENELSTLKEQQEQLVQKSQGVDRLHEQITKLQNDLINSNNKYDRHSAIAKSGITDPDVRDLIEWQFNRAMADKKKSDQIPLEEWLSTFKSDPESIPSILQPYFVSRETKTDKAAVEATKPTENVDPGSTLEAVPQKPTSNASVAPISDHATTADMWERATDYEYYRANRDKLKKSYYAEKRKKII